MKKKQQLFIDDTGTILINFLVLMFVTFFILMMLTSVTTTNAVIISFGIPSVLYLIFRAVLYFSMWNITNGKRRRNSQGKKVKLFNNWY